MSRGTLRRLLFVALALAYLLHNDVWLWYDSRQLLGLPVGLTYHLLFCLAVALIFGLLARFAWPDRLDSGDETS